MLNPFRAATPIPTATSHSDRDTHSEPRHPFRSRYPFRAATGGSDPASTGNIIAIFPNRLTANDLLRPHPRHPRRLAHYPSAPGRGWPPGTWSCNSGVPWATLLGTPARLLLLPEPVDRGALRLVPRRRLKAPPFALARGFRRSHLAGASDATNAARPSAFSARNTYRERGRTRMPCCGQKRALQQPSPATRPHVSPPIGIAATAQFEYLGNRS